MLTVRCPNKRHRPINGKRESIICNRVIGQIDDLEPKSIVFYCGSCRTFFNLTIKDKKPTLTLVNKKNLNFKNRLGFEVRGYQTEL